MSTDIRNKSHKLTYFGNITTRYCEPQKGKKITFHDTIQENKDFIFNFFDSQPYYNEYMPMIIKSNRGIHFYKKIIKKGLEAKSDFFKSIFKAIKKSSDDFSPKIEKTKTIRYYKIPKLELLKRRKQRFDNYLLNKNKTAQGKIKLLKKNKSMMEIMNPQNKTTTELMPKTTINNKTIINFNNTNYNILNSTVTADTFHTNNKKNESMSNFHNKYSLNKKMPTFYFPKNISNLVKDNNDNLNSPNINKKSKKAKKKELENLLNKCDEGLYFAINMGDDVENNSQNKSIEEVNKKLKDVLENKDKKLIEEKGLRNKKYQMLEREKFNELKRKMDIKVSDVYAYVNRKELSNFMRDNDTIFAYQIYLRDMNKINEWIAKKKVIEKKNISTVKELLDNTYRQKEFLKYKIDKYYIKHAKQDELKIFNLKNKDDFYVSKNNDKDDLKGSLLPKLYELKEFCYGRSKYNPIADMNNIYNEK